MLKKEKKWQKKVVGFVILAIIYLCSQFAVRFFDLLVPPAVVGLLILLLLLVWMQKVPSSLQSMAENILVWIPLGLVPVALGIFELEILNFKMAMALLLILSVSVTFSLGVTALLMKWLMGFLQKKPSHPID